MTTAQVYQKITSEMKVKSTDDETGTVTALVNSMGVVDADGDRLMPGAFEGSLLNLSQEPVAVLWGHDSKEVVGKVVDGYEIGLSDNEAVLYAEMLFNLKTQRGRDAYEDVKFGSVTQWSVGFNVASGDDIEIVKEGDSHITNIKKLHLVEVSAVLRGASPGTGTVSVKSAEPEAPELEEKAELFPGSDEFTTIEEARSRAEELGCSGVHQMEGEDRTYYMPCRNHDVYESIEHGTPSGNTYSEDLDTTKNHTEQAAADAIKAAAAKEIARAKIAWLTNKNKET
tara:strand:- start:3793 stop:4644 length:852 start_codon:yes stop_codon:yes gene_type:complete